MGYGFVKQCGGHVTIYSEVGHGTTMNLYFPGTDEAFSALASNKTKVRPHIVCFDSVSKGFPLATRRGAHDLPSLL